MNILHIHASNREAGSHSYAVAQEFLKQVSSEDVRVDYWNIWNEEIPDVNSAFLQAKSKATAGRELETHEQVLWSAVEKQIGRIRGADLIVISVPMWNFGIPHRLKHLIDVVTQPGYLFDVSEDGYRGLLRDIPTLVIAARGGAYAEGSGLEFLDHQTSYLKTILGFWGISNPEHVFIEPTMGDPETKAKALEQAKAAVTKFAANVLTPQEV